MYLKVSVRDTVAKEAQFSKGFHGKVFLKDQFFKQIVKTAKKKKQNSS